MTNPELVSLIISFIGLFVVAYFLILSIKDMREWRKEAKKLDEKLTEMERKLGIK
jgi:preprotein translocase subunit YajC